MTKRKVDIRFKSDKTLAIFPDGVRGAIKCQDGECYYDSDNVIYSADELRAIANKMDAMSDPDSGPDDEGWIPWDGGPCPVDGESLVEVRHESGGAKKYKAGALRWTHLGLLGDIVAYRVVEE